MQLLIVALGLAGLGLLAWRRWWWELVAMATPIVLVTPSAQSRWRPPRRNEVLMTLVFPLAAAGPFAGGPRPYRPRRMAPRQASSPPN